MKLTPLLLCVAISLGISLGGVARAEALDKATGLKKAPGWETVRNNCIACHSARLITQNAGSRGTWKSMIQWMQETQGLWAFDPKTEDIILTYLATYYGPKKGARRSPIDRTLLPENPYKKK
ncbi:hypothetical protein JYT31_02675 [Beggiatoa alba]|nr:hypothetical protein [Beggiatoa alba]